MGLGKEAVKVGGGMLIGYMLGSAPTAAAAPADKTLPVDGIVAPSTVLQNNKLDVAVGTFTVQGNEYEAGIDNYAHGIVLELAENLHLVKIGDGRTGSTRVAPYIENEAFLVLNGDKIQLHGPVVTDGSFTLASIFDGENLIYYLTGAGVDAIANYWYKVTLSLSVQQVTIERVPGAIETAISAALFHTPKSGTGPFANLRGYDPVSEKAYFQWSHGNYATDPTPGVQFGVIDEDGGNLISTPEIQGVPAEEPDWGSILAAMNKPVGTTDELWILLADGNAPDAAETDIDAIVMYTTNGGASWTYSVERSDIANCMNSYTESKRELTYIWSSIFPAGTDPSDLPAALASVQWVKALGYKGTILPSKVTYPAAI